MTDAEMAELNTAYKALSEHAASILILEKQVGTIKDRMEGLEARCIQLRDERATLRADLAASRAREERLKRAHEAMTSALDLVASRTPKNLEEASQLAKRVLRDHGVIFDSAALAETEEGT